MSYPWGPFDTEPCEKLIGVSFRDKDLLRHALTRIKSHEHSEQLRLALIGDRIVDVIFYQYLTKHHPEMSVREIAALRSIYCAKESQADFVTEIGLTAHLRSTDGRMMWELNGEQTPRLLSNAFEAIVGAIDEDNDRNLIAVREWLNRIWLIRVESELPYIEIENPVGALKRFCETHRLGKPDLFADRTHIDVMCVLLNGKPIAFAEGRHIHARRIAAIRAIRNLLRNMRSESSSRVIETT